MDGQVLETVTADFLRKFRRNPLNLGRQIIVNSQVGKAGGREPADKFRRDVLHF